MPSPRSPDFFVNLYIHNILAAVKLADTPLSYVLEDSGKPKRIDDHHGQRTDKREEEEKLKEEVQLDPLQSLWMTAEESLERREKEMKQKTSPVIRYDLSEFFQANEVNPKLKHTKRKD